MGTYLGYQAGSGLEMLDDGSGLEMVHISDCLDYLGLCSVAKLSEAGWF